MKKTMMTLVGAMLLTTQAQAESRGVASWYQCCNRTANGERFNPNGMTAAHRTMPFGTRLKVTHKGRSVVVRINDRGPFIRGRHLDLARGAAFAIGCKGTCLVTYMVMR